MPTLDVLLHDWKKQRRFRQWKAAEARRQSRDFADQLAARVTEILEAAGYELRAPHLVDDVAPRESEAAS